MGCPILTFLSPLFVECYWIVNDGIRVTIYYYDFRSRGDERRAPGDSALGVFVTFRNFDLPLLPLLMALVRDERGDPDPDPSSFSLSVSDAAETDSESFCLRPLVFAFPLPLTLPVFSRGARGAGESLNLPFSVTVPDSSCSTTLAAVRACDMDSLLKRSLLGISQFFCT